MDKRERADIFRERLESTMKGNGISRSAMARACGVDRSTIAQLLSEGETRLPNAHLAAECATALGVSADWLLGLTERPQTVADLLSTSFSLEEAGRTPAEEQVAQWHREAQGYKIRHVPATFPDILRTRAVIDFEYAAHLGQSPGQANHAVSEKLKWLRRPGSDYEICFSREYVDTLVQGEGHWRGLSAAARRDQLEHIARCCRELYPALRLYLYDVKVVYSAPLTVFGPLLATVYIGRYYMVFRETGQVRALTNHFDQLVRDCATDARATADEIEAML